MQRDCVSSYHSSHSIRKSLNGTNADNAPSMSRGLLYYLTQRSLYKKGVGYVRPRLETGLSRLQKGYNEASKHFRRRSKLSALYMLPDLILIRSSMVHRLVRAQLKRIVMRDKEVLQALPIASTISPC